MLRKTAVLIFMTLSMCLPAQETDAPLTFEEALAYVQASTDEELALEIMRLDAIEAAQPLLGWGEAALVYLGDGTYSIAFPILTIQIADLSYRVSFSPQTVELVIPAPAPPLPFFELATAAGVGFLVGIIVGGLAF
jgi:hypothetical protein